MKTLLQKGFELIDNDDLLKCVRVCLRLARTNNDYLNAAIFLRELSTDSRAFGDTFYIDTASLTREAQEMLFTLSQDKWMKERHLTYKNSNDDDAPEYYVKSVGELIHDIEHYEKSIDDFKTPTGMTPYDTAAFEDENKVLRAKVSSQLNSLYILKERIRSRCLNYLITFEKQITNQEKVRDLQFDFVNEVNNYFKEKDESTYQKLVKAMELLISNDEESYSLLLTEIRRTIKSVADYFYPPKEEIIKCSDGKERVLGNDQYLNRIQEYIATSVKKSTSQELLLLEYEGLEKISRKLNDLASKGVHNKISHREARQCFISFYNFVSIIIMMERENET